MTLYEKLDKMENVWTQNQKDILKARLNESLSKNQRDNFVERILIKCKNHGGPLTDIEELQALLAQHENGSLKKYLREEIQYQKAVHHKDSQERPELYKINNLSIAQMSENLLLMLSDQSLTENLIFATEEEIMDILKNVNVNMNEQ